MSEVFIEAMARTAEARTRDPIRYVITLATGARFYCADNGRIIFDGDRKLGPFSEAWRVLGFMPRSNSNRMIALASAPTADIGKGWVIDFDHGTHRMWASPEGRRAVKVEYVKPDYVTDTVCRGCGYAMGADGMIGDICPDCVEREEGKA